MTYLLIPFCYPLMIFYDTVLTKTKLMSKFSIDSDIEFVSYMIYSNSVSSLEVTVLEYIISLLNKIMA